MKNKVLLTNFTIFSLTRRFLFKIFLLIFIAHIFSSEQLNQSSVTYKTDTVCCSEYCFFFLLKTVKPLYCRKTFSSVRFTGSDISKHKSGQCAGITSHQFWQEVRPMFEQETVKRALNKLFCIDLVSLLRNLLNQ